MSDISKEIEKFNGIKKKRKTTMIIDSVVLPAEDMPLSYYFNGESNKDKKSILDAGYELIDKLGQKKYCIIALDTKGDRQLSLMWEKCMRYRGFNTTREYLRWLLENDYRMCKYDEKMRSNGIVVTGNA